MRILACVIILLITGCSNVDVSDVTRHRQDIPEQVTKNVQEDIIESPGGMCDCNGPSGSCVCYLSGR